MASGEGRSFRAEKETNKLEKIPAGAGTSSSFNETCQWRIPSLPVLRGSP